MNYIKNKDKYFFIGLMQKFSLPYISFYSIPVTPASRSGCSLQRSAGPFACRSRPLAGGHVTCISIRTGFLYIPFRTGIELYMIISKLRYLQADLQVNCRNQSRRQLKLFLIESQIAWGFPQESAAYQRLLMKARHRLKTWTHR